MFSNLVCFWDEQLAKEQNIRSLWCKHTMFVRMNFLMSIYLFHFNKENHYILSLYFSPKEFNNCVVVSYDNVQTYFNSLIPRKLCSIKTTLYIIYIDEELCSCYPCRIVKWEETNDLLVRIIYNLNRVRNVTSLSFWRPIYE